MPKAQVGFGTGPVKRFGNEVVAGLGMVTAPRADDDLPFGFTPAPRIGRHRLPGLPDQGPIWLRAEVHH